MGFSVVEKILKENALNFEDFKYGKALKLKVGQTLTQDATGTMAYLQFEALGIKRVKTKLSVAYVDHNMLQAGFMNADDHRYIKTVAKKYGIYYSKPGNGICHQVHLERFAVPGEILIGSDSHTPTAGGIGSLAFGAGGFDVACAMAGIPYEIPAPKIIKVNLNGHLRPWVSAKDIILKILQILTVKGGIGKILEYGGEGLKELSVPERATITNMGAELGATSSIFPSDEVTREFLKAQDREQDWKEIIADKDARYDDVLDLDLENLEPMVACPNSPDNVKTVSEMQGLKVDQVCIGSCTNSSLTDMMKVCSILRGNKVSSEVDLVISPGSRQVLTMLSRNGLLSDMIDAGARILESACGPCIGMGQSPKSKGISLRTFNRNFLGRSGTKDAQIYLVSPEVAAASAIKGFISLPEAKDFNFANFRMPEKFIVNDNMIFAPEDEEKADRVVVEKGPNIKDFPIGKKISNEIYADVVIKVKDNITTDHIMPAGAKILPYRSNIPYLSQFCFEVIDKDFHKKAQSVENGVIVAGENYGQGSSREHAALVPLYLGVKIVLAKSFARIHKANLINVGILPIIFFDEQDYEKIDEFDKLIIKHIKESMLKNEPIVITNITKNLEIKGKYELDEVQIKVILEGGRLNYIKNNYLNS